MKQTAVEELYKIWLFRNLTMDDFEQAKAMEREQIEDAYDAAINLEYSLDMCTSKEYYNQTYGGK